MEMVQKWISKSLIDLPVERHGCPFSVYSPDHPLKQIVNDKVGLSHHDQQGHMGPSKLWGDGNNVYTRRTSKEKELLL